MQETAVAGRRAGMIGKKISMVYIAWQFFLACLCVSDSALGQKDNPPNEYKRKNQGSTFLTTQDSGKQSEIQENFPAAPEEDVNLLDINYLSEKGWLLVVASKLNVRTGPGHRFPVRHTLRKGDRVQVQKKKGQWIKIGKKEWVFSNYLKPFRKKNHKP
ncbi:MAG: SH3 domain-containing protein [Deltaproteobacteria bacterium]|nr:SH3 domain-containing protein [Deltaproteobacteria bacterium]